MGKRFEVMVKMTMKLRPEINEGKYWRQLVLFVGISLMFFGAIFLALVNIVTHTLLKLD